MSATLYSDFCNITPGPPLPQKVHSLILGTHEYVTQPGGFAELRLACVAHSTSLIQRTSSAGLRDWCLKGTHCWLTSGSSNIKTRKENGFLQKTNGLVRNAETHIRIAVPADTLILAEMLTFGFYIFGVCKIHSNLVYIRDIEIVIIEFNSRECRYLKSREELEIKWSFTFSQ